jgi:BirA family biotin operon repressor/biotin-[acetyl-CoA-carboxylase] ligase
MHLTILRFDSIGSTNTEAVGQARRGADEGLCVVARRQSEGRGRHGRVWISPPDAGIYFSIVLRPRLEARFLPLITLMTAVAVHDALEELYRIEADIKWVNDIHVRHKKISGILAETIETPSGAAVVVGIGINLKSGNFPDELNEIATSIEAETGRAPDAEELLVHLTRRLTHFYETLGGPDGPEKIRAEWTRRSSYAAGKNVKIIMPDQIFTGTTRGIEENGALRVELETGVIKIIHAGEIENLRMF